MRLQPQSNTDTGLGPKGLGTLDTEDKQHQQ